MSSTRKLPSPDDAQYNLFGGEPTSTDASQLQTALNSGRRFVTGDARAIFLGPVRLEEHLKRCGQHAPLTVARLLAEQDWLPFEQRYAATGRAPYAPQLMVGLILYGVMQGVHSLRELERLARLDLGCMWVTGGIGPDHANIGRFIVQHECPEGQWPAKTKEEGLFHKSAFSDDPSTDTYRCPAGETLILFSKSAETARTRALSVYAASGCTDCKLRANCTKAAQGRRIKRYHEDAQREALRQVMQHRQARRIFSQRKAIVEPVFSSLRGQ